MTCCSVLMAWPCEHVLSREALAHLLVDGNVCKTGPVAAAVGVFLIVAA